MPLNANWNRWSSKLVGAAIASALLVLVAVTVFVVLAYQESASALVAERDRQVTNLSAAQLKDRLLGFADPLAELARAPEMRGGTVAETKEALQRAGTSLAVFDGGVVFIDGHGTVRATEPQFPELVGRDWSDTELFRGLLASKTALLSDAAPDGPNGATVVLLGLPVFGDNGEFVGALAGMFRLGEPKASSFYASIVRLRIGQSGSTYLVDGNGRILYDSLYSRVGQEFTEYDLRDPALRAGSGGRVHDEDGRDVFVALAPVPGTDWTLVAEDDWAQVVGPARRYAAVMLGLLVVGVVLTVSGTLFLARQRRDIVQQQDLVAQETWASQLVEQKLLPRQLPSLVGWGLSVFHRPVQNAGKDFYDFAYLPDGRLMIAVADVGCDGIGGALAMACTRAVLRANARRCLPAHEALSQSNDLLCPEMEADGYVNCQYAVLDPSSARLEVASAGSYTPFRCGNGVTAEVTAPGSPLGLALGALYDPMELSIDSGERLVFYTAGLVSARNSEGEAFGTARLQELLSRHVPDGEALLQTLFSEVARFAGPGWTPSDDITVVILERQAAAEAG